MAERAYASVLLNAAGALQPLGAASQRARLDLENEGVGAIIMGFVSEPWARSPPLDPGPSTPPSSLESEGACPRRGVSPEGVSPEGRVPGAWTRSQSAGSGGGALAGFVLFSSSQCHSRPNPLIFIGRESESPTINSSHQSSRVCKTVLAGFAGAIPSLILNFRGGHSGLNPSQPIPCAHWFPATGPEASLQPPSDSSMAWRPLGVKEPGVCFKRCVKTQRHRNECHEEVYT